MDVAVGGSRRVGVEAAAAAADALQRKNIETLVVGNQIPKNSIDLPAWFALSHSATIYVEWLQFMLTLESWCLPGSERRCSCHKNSACSFLILSFL